MDVGFIGLGAMGGRIARRILAAGHGAGPRDGRADEVCEPDAGGNDGGAEPRMGRTGTRGSRWRWSRNAPVSRFALIPRGFAKRWPVRTGKDDLS